MCWSAEGWQVLAARDIVFLAVHGHNLFAVDIHNDTASGMGCCTLSDVPTPATVGAKP